MTHSRWFRCGIKRMYQEKNEAIRIASKNNNSLETFSYAIQKHHAMHQSDLQIPSDHSKLVPEEVKKTTESTKK